MESKIEELNEKLQAHLGGGKDRIAKQHQKKKLTARERVDYLMDEGSLKKLILVTHRTTDFGMAKELYYGDGVITGYGTINGRLVYVLLRILPFWWGTL
jgi:propionyl-CoA carboxylase beta chain